MKGAVFPLRSVRGDGYDNLLKHINQRLVITIERSDIRLEEVIRIRAAPPYRVAWKRRVVRPFPSRNGCSASTSPM